MERSDSRYCATEYIEKLSGTSIILAGVSLPFQIQLFSTGHTENMLMLTPAHVRAPAGVSRARPRRHSGGCCSMQSTPSPLTHLFYLSANNYTSPPSLSFCRCERAGPMRLFPSMPLACHHTIPTSSTGWILALALLFALQVKFSSNCLISYNVFFF